jgi:hypothetical protein
MIQLIIILVIAAAALGGGFFKVQQWKSEARAEGVAQCQAQLAEANRQLKVTADALNGEAANHITDMVAAEDFGRSQSETRIIYRQAKGASDVSKYPVFQNPACTLPADSLRNLNAARASIRRDVPDDPAVGVRDDGTGRGASATAGAPANSGQVPAAVPGTGAPAGGNVRSPLPKNAR